MDGCADQESRITDRYEREHICRFARYFRMGEEGRLLVPNRVSDGLIHGAIRRADPWARSEQCVGVVRVESGGGRMEVEGARRACTRARRGFTLRTYRAPVLPRLSASKRRRGRDRRRASRPDTQQRGLFESA